MNASRRIVLLSNPAARNGKGARVTASVAARLRSGGLDVRETVGVDESHSLAIAREAADSGADVLVVVGGDGIVNVAIQALAHTPTALGIIPTGTGNDAARALGISLEDPLAAADTVVTGGLLSIDLARAGDRYYATAMAAGFDAAVNERANAMSWPRGQSRYTLAIVAELFAFNALPYEVTLDGTELREEAMLVTVANGSTFGGGIRIAPEASLDDGLLDVVVVSKVSKRELIKMMPQLRTGAIAEHPAYTVHRVREVTVSSPGVVAYADGERLGPLPLTVECVPGALTVLA